MKLFKYHQWTLWLLAILSFCERISSERRIEYNVTTAIEDTTEVLYMS
jgi:hypothetical protein